MKITSLVKLAIVTGVCVFTLNGCGDNTSTSASGIGATVNGNWSGQLNSNNAPFSTFTMSLSQPSANLNSPFEDSPVSGSFVSSNSNISSGSITGSLQENSISLTIGPLTMTGRVDANSMSGSWSNSSTATTTAISLSGTWGASR
jgi:hypothetical protein